MDSPATFFINIFNKNLYKYQMILRMLKNKFGINLPKCNIEFKKKTEESSLLHVQEYNKNLISFKADYQLF